MNALVKEGRLGEEDFVKKTASMFGCDPMDAEEVLRTMLRANDELVQNIAKEAQRVQKQMEKEEKRAREDKEKKRKMINDMAGQIEKAIQVHTLPLTLGAVLVCHLHERCFDICMLHKQLARVRHQPPSAVAPK